MEGLSKLSKGGVINNPPLVNKEITKCKFQAKNWVMTWHNYPDNVFEQIEQHLVPLCVKYVFGKELGKSGKTPHIQGAFVLKKKIRQDTIWNMFGIEFYLDKMAGKWNDQKYCAKEAGGILTNVKFALPTVLMTYDQLRQEQKDIADLFVEDENPLFGRKVHWFWESQGCWGKSILCKYLLDHMGAMVVEGANNDILCGVSKYIEEHGTAPRMIVFDIPRVNEGGCSYQAIEKLKNGYFFSGKYESGMCRFNSPHILCFSNGPPIRENLSKDRWEITKLVKCKCDRIGAHSGICCICGI